MERHHEAINQCSSAALCFSLPSISSLTYTMLARKLPRSSQQAASLIRTFTTSSVCGVKPRSPALSDISPGSAEAYNQRQKEFRDGLEAAKKKKDQLDRQLRSAPKPPSAYSSDTTSPSTSSKPSAMFETMGLGSLSTSTGEARQAETDTSTKGSGRFSNLIYGTPEGRRHDQVCKWDQLCDCSLCDV